MFRLERSFATDSLDTGLNIDCIPSTQFRMHRSHSFAMHKYFSQPWEQFAQKIFPLWNTEDGYWRIKVTGKTVQFPETTESRITEIRACNHEGRNTDGDFISARQGPRFAKWPTSVTEYVHTSALMTLRIRSMLAKQSCSACAIPFAIALIQKQCQNVSTILPGAQCANCFDYVTHGARGGAR